MEPATLCLTKGDGQVTHANIDAATACVVTLAEYLICKPAPREQIPRWHKIVKVALMDGDHIDLYLHDGGYSRLMLWPSAKGNDVVALSAVSLPVVKARWTQLLINGTVGQRARRI